MTELVGRDVSRETLSAIEALGVSRETIERLGVFTDLLRRWAPRINLISRNDIPQLWGRHILDALQLLPLIPPNTSRATDIGSGAGFPGLILAIAAAIQFDLVEADQRKCAFLREAARATNATVQIHAHRIEALKLLPAPLITARALAPLGDLLSLAAPLAAPDGFFLFPKGTDAEQELTGAGAAWNMRVERFPSALAGGGVILRISEVSPRA